MAHYALIDESNIVVGVITGVDENTTQVEKDGSTVGGSTEAWESFYSQLPWFAGLSCKRTSYNAATNGYRKNYAGIGYTYDSARDAFIPPKPFSSWILDENTCLWEPPIPYPNDDNRYRWNEDNQSWEKVELN